MKTPYDQPLARPRNINRAKWILIALVATLVSLSAVWADTTYTAKAGKIAFSVGSNIPLVKVAGSSSAVRGGGAATVAESTATIHDLHFEVDPVSFKTGIKLRDDHLYERVFTAADGSKPTISLRADHFSAKLDPATSKWEGTLHAQVTMRGVTKPVSFHATAEKKGEGAVVSADGVVKTSDFGVKPISYSGATVRDEVTITVSNLTLQP